jgi:hypothetical protein
MTGTTSVHWVGLEMRLMELVKMEERPMMPISVLFYSWHHLVATVRCHVSCSWLNPTLT